MDKPIVFISRNRIKPGMQADFIQHYQGSIPTIKAGKPGTLVQLAYISADGAEVTIVRLFPNAEALERQLQGADQRSKVAFQFIEPTGVEIFGSPGGKTLEMVQKIAGAGIEVIIHPEFSGGFVRSKPE